MTLSCSPLADGLAFFARCARRGTASLAAAVLALCRAASAPAQQIETPAAFGYLIDLSSDTVLLDKSASTPTAPRSGAPIKASAMEVSASQCRVGVTTGWPSSST